MRNAAPVQLHPSPLTTEGFLEETREQHDQRISQIGLHFHIKRKKINYFSIENVKLTSRPIACSYGAPSCKDHASVIMDTHVFYLRLLW